MNLSALPTRDLVASLTGSSVCAEAAATYGLRALADDTVPLSVAPRTRKRLAAALELGRRLATEEVTPPATFRRSEDTARYLLPRYGTLPVEHFGVLLLNTRHGLIHEAVVSVGCLTASLVHPREVFKTAIGARAAGLVLFHNHPSGDPEPSAEDLALTRRLTAAGSLLGIDVLDHVILAGSRSVSLKERGLL